LLIKNKNDTKKLKIENKEDVIKKEIKKQNEIIDKILLNPCEVCEFSGSYNTSKEDHNKFMLEKFGVVDKPVFIIIDDNEGIISYILDTINDIFSENNINPKNYKIVTFSGVNAIYSYLGFLKEYNKYIFGGIFDLTIGGIKRFQGMNIRLNGLDAIYASNKLGIKKFILFTGNTINPKIRENKIVLERYKNIIKRDIKEDLIFKSDFNNDLKRIIYEKFFKD
jgi:transcription termination factor Rho